MAYVRVESSVARHRKFVKAGPAASWLWLCGLAYCQEGLTDGFIPEEALDYLGVKKPNALVAQLVGAGLWEPIDGKGWQVHDYLQHNRSSERVKHIQRERREAGSKGGSAQANNRTRLEQQLEQQLEPVLNPATATVQQQRHAQHTAPAPRRPGAPLITSHRSCAACGRVCVPAALHGEFVRRRNTPNADKELRDFYGTVDDEWSSTRQGEEPGDPFAFWRERYAERWPSVKAAPKDAGPKSVSAFDHPYAKQYTPTRTGS